MYRKYYLKDVLEQSNKKLFTHISTFTGGGGSSVGVKLAGGNTLLVNEFVEEAVKTYQDNFNNANVILGDIKEQSGQDFLDKAGIKKGELDLLEGSPPCSAFSVCGSVTYNKDDSKPVSLFDDDADYFIEADSKTINDRMGWNKTKTYSDGKQVENIEDLFFEFIRIANDIQPKVIIAENVAGLTIGESKKYLNKILNEFEKIGYLVTYKVVNSIDYGVAQARKRVIFLAIRNDIADEKHINQFNIAHIYPEPISKPLTLQDVIGTMQYGEVWKHGEQKWMQHLMRRKTYQNTVPFINEIVEIQKVDDNYHKFSSVIPGGNKYFSYYVLSMSKHTPTLTQVGLQAANFIHPSGKRPLSIQEALRLMGLPEDYKLTGTPNQKFERLGRMVTPPIYEQLCKNIYETILK